MYNACMAVMALILQLVKPQPIMCGHSDSDSIIRLQMQLDSVAVSWVSDHWYSVVYNIQHYKPPHMLDNIPSSIMHVVVT